VIRPGESPARVDQQGARTLCLHSRLLRERTAAYVATIPIQGNVSG